MHYTTKYDWVLVKWVLDKILSADSNIPGHTTTEDRQNRIQAISSGAAIPLQSVKDIIGEPTKLQALFSDLASKVAMKILLSSLDPEHIIRIHSESDEGAACIQTQPTAPDKCFFSLEFKVYLLLRLGIQIAAEDVHCDLCKRRTGLSTLHSVNGCKKDYITITS